MLYRYHHSAYMRGYISVKAKDGIKTPYTGRFGTGYILKKHSYRSSRYCCGEYWIETDKNTVLNEIRNCSKMCCRIELVENEKKIIINIITGPQGKEIKVYVHYGVDSSVKITGSVYDDIEGFIEYMEGVL